MNGLNWSRSTYSRATPVAVVEPVGQLGEDALVAGQAGQGVAGRLLVGAPQRGADVREQHLGFERLGQVAVGAGVEPLDRVGRLAAGRQQHDGQVGGPGVLAQPPQRLEPVHAGHHDVEEDEVRRPALPAFERVDAVHRLDDVVARERRA